MDAKGEKIASTFRFSGEGSPKTIRAMKDDASLIVHAVNTYEEREKLLEQAERLIFDMSAVFDLNNLAPSKVKAARDFLAKLEARDA